MTPMTRTKFFIISSAIIFVLERALSIIAPWPIFIFPIFVILFVLTSKSDTDGLPYIIIISFIFDFFSGLPFGLLTVAILAVFLTIYLAKAFLSISGRPMIFTLALSLVFVFEYFFLLSVKISPRAVLSQAPVILLEAVLLLIPMKFLFGKLKLLTTYY
jgi:hypothetical protein